MNREPICVYCERTGLEIALEDKIDDLDEVIQPFIVRKRRVRLCQKCQRRFAPRAFIAPPVEDDDEPITFPPGITRIGHICPALTLQGLGEDDATITLTLQKSGDYLAATCPHCGVSVRSLFADPTLGEDGEVDY